VLSWRLLLPLSVASPMHLHADSALLATAVVLLLPPPMLLLALLLRVQRPADSTITPVRSSSIWAKAWLQRP